MASIDNLITLLKNKARAELEKTGELKPKAYFFLKLPDMPNAIFYNIDIDFIDINNFDDKVKLPAHFRRQWIKKVVEHAGNVELLAVAVITDTFYSQYIADGDVDPMQQLEELRKTAPPPSKDPNRKEALQFSIGWPDRYEKQAHFYERHKNKIVFKEILTMDRYAETWMTNIYPKLS